MKLLLLLAALAASRDVAGIIPVCEDGKLLLVSNSKNHYIFPKGGVKKKRNESLLQAALREAHEEAGIGDYAAPEPFGTVRNTTYFVMRVRSMDDVFKESRRRKRLLIHPREALEHEEIPKYIKDIIRLIVESPMFN